MNLVTSEMNWAKMKNEYISAYAETYTEDELKAMIGFYKSPVGQTIAGKDSDITKKLMQISQKRMMDLMPKIQAMIKETMSKALPASSTSPAPTPVPAKPPVK